MADPDGDPGLVEGTGSPSAERQLPDPPDTGGGMESVEKEKSSSCGENAGCSEDGEGRVEVTPPRSDCGSMPAGDLQDCASARDIADKENVAHGCAPPALLASSPAPEAGAAPPASPPVPEDEAVPLSPPASSCAPGDGAAALAPPASAPAPGDGAAVLAPPATPASEDGVTSPAPPASSPASGDGAAPFAPLAPASVDGAVLAPPPAPEDGAAPPAPEIVPAVCTEEAASDVTSDHKLVEANRDGAWFKAIEAKDCLSLMNILKAQKDFASCLSLCFETGEQGRTALHVAAMQGCFRLAKQLINLVVESYPNIAYQITSRQDGPVKTFIRLSPETSELIYGQDGRSGLSAFEMANDIIGNTSISQYVRYVGRDPDDQKYSIMYEAYKGTLWHMALAGRDCKQLEHLLKTNSHLLLETCGGLSVLDVAILKGDEKLVKQVMGFFRATAKGPEIRWKESYFPSELRWEQIAKRHLPVYYVGSIFELAEKLGRPEAFKELLQNFEGHVRGSKNGVGEVRSVKIEEMLTYCFHLSLHEFDLVYDEERVDLVYDEERVDFVNDDHLHTVLIEAKRIKDCWNHEWTAGFMEDVDYNFEDNHSLLFYILRVNYAFKNPRQCKSFLDKYCTWYEEMLSMVSIYARDGQGRTPLHTMVDQYNPKYLTLDELNKSMRLIPVPLDSRGRSPMIRALTKQFLEPKIMVSSHYLKYFQGGERKVDMESIAYEKLRDRSQNNNISMFQGLYLASFLYEDVNVLRLITSKEEHKNEIKDFINVVHVNSSCHEVPQSKALFIAAGLGNQTLLREWFKFKFDCMVEDGKGRTALHYAADANLLEFMSPPTSFFCSVDHPKKVEEEWMTRRKVEKANLNVGQDTNENPQSNASVGRKACILMLLQAGVDLSQEDKDGNIPDPGASSDTEFQSWWYNLVVKDSEDKKNSFNQAGNALSVVGTLVAATSYIGPLQPPLSYSEHNGYVDTSRSLVKVFMWTNTLAFYLAVASVMFAVVPSLPMPQEGVIDELRRARNTVSSSLFLLLASIVCILVSFAAATAVVVDNGDYYEAHDFLLSPSIIGWFFCGIAMVSFFIRVMRLVFYRNPVIRQIYKFSFSAFLKMILKRKLRRIIILPVFCLLFVPVLLEFGLILMIISMVRGLRRLWKELLRHQEPGSSTAGQVLPQRPENPIEKLGDRISDWISYEA